MRTGICVASIAIIATAAWVDRPEPTPALADLDLELALAWGCSKCSEGCDGTPRSHQMWGLPKPGKGYKGHPESKCYPAQCNVHDPCGKDGPEVELSWQVFLAVTQAIRSATPTELMEAANRHPGQVQINRDRGALQLIGCESEVVASYTATSLPALATLLD